MLELDRLEDKRVHCICVAFALHFQSFSCICVAICGVLVGLLKTGVSTRTWLEESRSTFEERFGCRDPKLRRVEWRTSGFEV